MQNFRMLFINNLMLMLTKLFLQFNIMFLTMNIILFKTGLEEKQIMIFYQQHNPHIYADFQLDLLEAIFFKKINIF